MTLNSDGGLQLWDARGSAASETGSVVARFRDPEFWGHAAYSAHPRQVLVTDRTGVAVWDMRVGELLKMFNIMIFTSIILAHVIQIGALHWN